MDLNNITANLISLITNPYYFVGLVVTGVAIYFYLNRNKGPAYKEVDLS